MKNILKKIGEYLMKDEITELKEETNLLREKQELFEKRSIEYDDYVASVINGFIREYGQKDTSNVNETLNEVQITEKPKTDKKILTKEEKIQAALKRIVFNEGFDENTDYFAEHNKRIVESVNRKFDDPTIKIKNSKFQKIKTLLSELSKQL